MPTKSSKLLKFQQVIKRTCSYLWMNDFNFVMLFAIELLHFTICHKIVTIHCLSTNNSTSTWLFINKQVWLVVHLQQLKWPFWMDEKNYIQIMTKNSSTWIKKLKNKKNKKENLENPITKIKRKKIKYASQQVWVGVHLIP